MERRDRFCAPTQLLLLPGSNTVETLPLPTEGIARCLDVEDEIVPTSARDEPLRNSGAWSRFDIKEVLGRGAVGAVYRAVVRNDVSEEVALKVVDVADQELRAVAQHEHDMLRSLDCPYIIRAVEFFASDVEAVIVLEYFAGMTLTNTVARSQPQRRLKEIVSRDLFSMLAQALEYLHTRRIVHRDVKPDNVLVDLESVTLRLIDFHTARQVDEVQQDMSLAFGKAGTTLFAAPEVVTLDEPAMEANDMWAAGLCLYFMLSRRIPRGCGEPGFGSEASEMTELAAAQPVLFEESCWGKISEPCKDIVRRCASVDKGLRPTAFEVLASAWLTGEGAEREGGEGAQLREMSPLSPTGFEAVTCSVWAQDSWSSTPSTSAGTVMRSARGSLSRTWSPVSAPPMVAAGAAHEVAVPRATTADSRLLMGRGGAAARRPLPAAGLAAMGAPRAVAASEGYQRELAHAALRTERLREDRGPGLGRRDIAR